MRLLILAAMVLTACGSLPIGDFCTQLTSGLNYAHTQQTDCPDVSLDLPFETERCDDVQRDCTSSERSVVLTYAQCLKKLPRCKPGAEAAFASAVRSCVSPVRPAVETQCLP